MVPDQGTVQFGSLVDMDTDHCLDIAPIFARTGR